MKFSTLRAPGQEAGDAGSQRASCKKRAELLKHLQEPFQPFITDGARLSGEVGCPLAPRARGNVKYLSLEMMSVNSHHTF